MILNSLPNDDNTRHVNNVIFRTVRIEDDAITEFNSDGSEGASVTQTVISESYKSVFNILNVINVSVDLCGNNDQSRPRSLGAPPIIISIQNLSPTSTPGEKVNSPTTSADVYENNQNNINNNFLELLLNQIFLLKDRPNNFIEFENDMKPLECKHIYSYQYNDNNDNYIKDIESIFRNDVSLSVIL